MLVALINPTTPCRRGATAGCSRCSMPESFAGKGAAILLLSNSLAAKAVTRECDTGAEVAGGATSCVVAVSTCKEVALLKDPAGIDSGVPIGSPAPGRGNPVLTSMLVPSLPTP